MHVYILKSLKTIEGSILSIFNNSLILQNQFYAEAYNCTYNLFYGVVKTQSFNANL